MPGERPKWVEDCVKAIESNPKKSKGVENPWAVCQAAYNKRKKEGKELEDFNEDQIAKIETIQNELDKMTDKEQFIQTRLLEKGHSNPQKGAEKIKTEEYQYHTIKDEHLKENMRDINKGLRDIASTYGLNYSPQVVNIRNPRIPFVFRGDLNDDYTKTLLEEELQDLARKNDADLTVRIQDFVARGRFEILI
jgi:hypothetical protein